MIIGLLALLLVLVILVMTTLGAVLLARFLLGPGKPARRIAAAAFGSPVTLLALTFAMSFADDRTRTVPEVGAAFVVLAGLFSFVAWPVAHFATRGLDRLTRFDPSVFE